MKVKLTDEELKRSLERIPPLSSVVVKSLEKIRNPLSSAKDIAEEIAKDPILSLDILKIANSPLYGFSREITSLEHAVSLLGIKAVESIILSAYAKRVYSVELRNFKIKRGELSLQSFIGGYVAKLVSERFFPQVEDLAFSSAVVRNIGKIAMDFLMSKYVDKVKAELINERDFQRVERKLFGFTSYDLSIMILDLWKIPEDIKFVVSKFNNVGLIKDKKSKLYQAAVCVHVGDRVAQLTGVGAGIDNLAYSIDQDIFKSTQIKPSDIEEFLHKVIEVLPELEKKLKETLI